MLRLERYESINTVTRGDSSSTSQFGGRLHCKSVQLEHVLKLSSQKGRLLRTARLRSTKAKKGRNVETRLLRIFGMDRLYQSMDMVERLLGTLGRPDKKVWSHNCNVQIMII
jgi:hypothetical protein